MKTCKKCKEQRSVSEYYNDKSKPDGLNIYCIPCIKLRNADRREYNNEQSKKWRSENPDRKREIGREWYHRNKDKSLEYKKEYRARNLDRHANNENRRRARKKDNLAIPYLLQDVLDKYGIVCYLCSEQIDMQAPRKVGKIGWERGLHVDHVVSISNGGSDTIDNVRPTHALCNLKKSRGSR